MPPRSQLPTLAIHNACGGPSLALGGAFFKSWTLGRFSAGLSPRKGSAPSACGRRRERVAGHHQTEIQRGKKTQESTGGSRLALSHGNRKDRQQGRQRDWLRIGLPTIARDVQNVAPG